MCEKLFLGCIFTDRRARIVKNETVVGWRHRWRSDRADEQSVQQARKH